MRVLLAGGTGFTGRRVLRGLVRAGHRVRCLVREGSDLESMRGLAVETVTGDLGDPESVRAALEEAEGLVNMASLGFGHGPGIVAACEAAGVERAVFLSTTGIFTSLPSVSRATRLAAEEAIRGSRLGWTILRPTMIYGAAGDRNVERLLRVLARSPVIPMVGRGERKVQPVLVDDVADAAVRALSAVAAPRRCYAIPGREPVSFGEFVREAARALGRKILLVPVPEAFAVGAARVCEALPFGPRIGAEQVLRLLEDKDFFWGEARRDLGYDPVSVAEGLRIEVERLGLGRRP